MLRQDIREKSVKNRDIKHRNPMFDPDTRKKSSLSHMGKPLSEQHKQNLRGKIPWMKGKHHTKKTKKQMKKNHADFRGEKSPLFGSHPNEESLRKMLNISTPSGPELYLDFILQNHFPDEWEFTGDGGFILHGLCPDFINCNGRKQIIELFGERWHTGKIPLNRTEAGRREIFVRSGYDLLVIWDYELVDEKKVIEKIKDFKGNTECMK